MPRPTAFPPLVKRARPLLGTYVAIHVGGLAEDTALVAIERGFAAIADIHRLMSFHEPDSDLSRMNRDALGAPVTVDPRTLAVLSVAAELAEQSGGVFDVTIGSEQVRRGRLPFPAIAHEAPTGGDWQDVALIPPDGVRYRRPLWIDLGGIAKGYAVDLAIEAMNLPDWAQCVVNAGGDLRVAGPAAERVLLRAPPGAGAVPVVEIENGSLASSGGSPDDSHLDGQSRTPVPPERFVSVAANDCIIADALTKAAPILRSHGAVAYLHDGAWSTIGATA
jgi:thiamine biosynthesis lipoprotein